MFIKHEYLKIISVFLHCIESKQLRHNFLNSEELQNNRRELQVATSSQLQCFLIQHIDGHDGQVTFII